MVLLSGLCLLMRSGSAPAASNPEVICQGIKLREAATAAARLLICHGTAARRGAPVNPACLTRATDRLATAFAGAERVRECATSDDGATISADIEAFASTLVAALRPLPGRSICAGIKLIAAAQQAILTVGAHARDLRLGDDGQLFNALQRTGQRVGKVWDAAERQPDCAAYGDAAVVQAALDRAAGNLLVQLSPSATLRHAGDRLGLRIGAAAGDGDVLLEAAYTHTLAREFNYLTPENALKWGPIHPAPDTWNFAPADALVDFAAAHGMRVKGHTLVWHQQLADYINLSLTPAELQTAMATHIETLVSRYRGRVAVWDAVNEAVRNDGTGLAPSVFYLKLGAGFIANAFHLAHAADPDALLLYNDYGAETINAKSNYIYAMVQDLLAQGVPIHGVGFQMHLNAQSVDPAGIRSNLQRFADLGVKVHITEMDARIAGLPGDLASRLATQRQVYHDVVAACLAVAGCDAIAFWGFTDKYSWIDTFFGPDDPLLFDEQYARKPAYAGVFSALLGQ
jgi:GH35 family endo-1,4-beta-xylanase